MFDPEPEDTLTPTMMAVLGGKVWHSTSVAGFEAIVADGFIRAKPPVNRHQNSFCQFLGRVSLFDFREAPKLMEAVERGDWWSFTDIRPDDMAVWLRIDHSRIDLPTAASLIDEWRVAEAAGQINRTNCRIIMDIETGYAGDIPMSAVADILLIDGLFPTENETIPFDGDAVARVHAFRAAVAAKERTGLAAKMRDAERRRNAV
ncbi:hypothetical protein ASD79_16445 [Caulobacter sp. Root655]|uniref:hypothetical protein n=1 Tax=Caulobacter sp. Root655 TaxID=1736578 RepID=UPI0006FC888E|nr:hypothetical protein [Caulobacter sp. Root655]KRA56656.1 hypothetical protein ASD79_16445 [Caulobacter sp. Root655]